MPKGLNPNEALRFLQRHLGVLPSKMSDRIAASEVPNPGQL